MNASTKKRQDALRTLRTVAGLVAVGAVAVLASGCATAETAADTAQESFSNDISGGQPLEGVVRIASVDRSMLAADGTVRYVLDNISGEDQENLSARVIFYYPPSKKSEIALEFDADVTEEQRVVLFSGQTGLEVSATSRVFAARKEQGDAVLATRIDVTREELVPMIERAAGGQGSRFFNGQLELVDIAPEDLRWGVGGAEPQLWFDIENVSRGAIDNLELKVLVLDTSTRDRAGETQWQKVASLAPGATVRLDVNLLGAGPVRGRDFILKARQSLDLFGF